MAFNQVNKVDYYCNVYLLRETKNFFKIMASSIKIAIGICIIMILETTELFSLTYNNKCFAFFYEYTYLFACRV